MPASRRGQVRKAFQGFFPPLGFGIALVCLAAASLAAAGPLRENPLVMTAGAGRAVENCADPTVIRAQTPGDAAWYMYCTSDALGDWDTNAQGDYNYHLIPTFRSTDLVHWEYQRDAFTTRPDWAEFWSNLWAPEIQFINGQYLLYYAATDTNSTTSGEPNCDSDSAIGVATSPSPTGPWTHAAQPVVRPRRNGAGCDFLATIDPELTQGPAGARYIYFGSFKGGIRVRKISADGLTSFPPTEVAVAAADRFEGPEVVRRDGYYYLLLSAAGCCNGPLSGYIVFAGRSISPTGPFVDRQGVSLGDGRSGGTPLLAATGNRWIGPGHNTVVTDLSGQDWTIYHAIEESDPYFAGATGYTRRPAMLDPLDWIDGWPAVRGGWWVSDCPQPAPVAVLGAPPDYRATAFTDDRPGSAILEASDEFDGSALEPPWSWIRPPSPSSYGVEDGALRMNTSSGELYEDNDTAPVLVRPAPAGAFVVETRFSFDVPASGCCYNFAQAGLVIHGDDDNYLKLVHAAIGSQRMTEWAKEWGPAPAGFPRYDKSFLGPPGDWTWLRVVVRPGVGGALFTGYSSHDGVNWTRGSTWRHSLGATPRLGLLAMNLPGYTARFDYLRVFELAGPECSDPALADPCDPDADGTGDRCDPDDDGDGVSDPEDCAAHEADQGKPGEIQGLAVTPGRLSWEAFPTAEVYDATRGPLPGIGEGEYGICLADDCPDTWLDEPSRPDPGNGFFYLVRGVDAGCGGPGSLGRDSRGRERVNQDPGMCP